MKVSLVSAILCFVITGSVFGQQALRIIDKPIIFDSVRQNLSLAYLEDRHQLQQTKPIIKPIMVVLHWTGGTTLHSAYQTFNKSTLENDRRELAGASNLNVSAHYLVDRDGTIYQLLPDTVFARHVIGLNYCAIGIENVGSEAYPLTEAQLKANEKLVRHLKSIHDIQYLIGHYEYTRFKNTKLWKEADTNYETKKYDPGKDFMQKIRISVNDLHLKGAIN